MISCPGCRANLKPQNLNTGVLTPCPSCGVKLRVDVFPAALETGPGAVFGDTLTYEHGAGCFYHPGKKAVIPCSSCGRFLCALCDIDFGGQHICPACLAAGKKKGRIATLENQRTLYDSIALSMAVAPLLFFWLTIVTAPIAIYLVIRYWKAPTSIVGRTKIRFVAAFLLALAQIVGWVLLINHWVS